MKKIFILAILLFSNASAFAASHGISLLGDLKYPQDFKNFDYVNSNAPKGGEVTMASIGSYDSFNPFILKGDAVDGIGFVFDSLMVSSADEESSQYGLIAESVEIEPKSVTFNLRKEAKWHDGSPITAEDVVFSFYSLKERGNPYYAAYYHDVISAEELSSHKVKFNFANDNNKELPLIVSQLTIISKKYYSDHDFTKTTLEPPMGSGPYKIKSFEAGRSVTYERVKDYWAKDLPVNKGRYNFDVIKYDYYRDASIAIEALKAGKYDFRKENISKSWNKEYDIPQVKNGKMIKEILPDGTPTGMQCFVMNTRRANFKDPKFREALNYAYDFEWANKQLFYSAYTRNNSFFENSIFASQGLPSDKELELLDQFKDILPNRVFTSVYLSPKSDGSGNNRPNLLKAKQLLEEAGWYLRDMKLINPVTKEPVKIEFLLNSPTFEKVAAPYIKDLKKLGIESSMRLVDSSQYIKRLQEFDFDIIAGEGFAQGPSPGNEQRDYWNSAEADRNGSKNLIGIKNKAVDFMVDKIISAKNKEELIAATRSLDRILLWNFYVVPQWHSRTHRLIYWNKFARPKINPPYALAFIDTWWIKDLDKMK